MKFRRDIDICVRDVLPDFIRCQVNWPSENINEIAANYKSKRICFEMDKKTLKPKELKLLRDNSEEAYRKIVLGLETDVQNLINTKAQFYFYGLCDKF